MQKSALRAELERYMKGAEGFEKRLQEVKTEMRREFEMMVGPKTLNELKELLESRKRLLKKLPPKYVAKE